MAVKNVCIRIVEEMLEKIRYIVDYEGYSLNSDILILIRKYIKAFEGENGI